MVRAQDEQALPGRCAQDSIETFKREVVNEQSDEVDIVINDEKAAGFLSIGN